MENQTNQENIQKDQADGKFDQNLKGNISKEPLSSQAVSDDDEQAGSVYSDNLMSNADTQVRATEDASLQDDTYAFDEDNTSNEDIHDIADFGDVDSDLFDSQEDYQ